MLHAEDWAREKELRAARLYSTKQTPRGSVVVLGDRLISEYEMPTPHAQQQADWLNHRKSACPVTSL